MKSIKYVLPLMISASLFTGTVALAQSAEAPAPQTQVEMKNEIPAAPAPNVDIDMPDAPDVNVVNPGGSTTNRETRTDTSSTTIIDDNDDADTVPDNNIWIFAIFGILAVLVIGIMIAASNRRTVID